MLKMYRIAIFSKHDDESYRLSGFMPVSIACEKLYGTPDRCCAQKRARNLNHESKNKKRTARFVAWLDPETVK